VGLKRVDRYRADLDGLRGLAVLGVSASMLVVGMALVRAGGLPQRFSREVQTGAPAWCSDDLTHV
jgi:peptidoglycan/LPS O-acetylase OafA/YrhL